MATKKVKTQLCTAVSADTAPELASKAELAFSLGSDLVEFRIDRLAKPGTPRELEAELSVFSSRAIFTVRSGREGGGFMEGERSRLDLISRAADIRPAYIDVELATLKENEKWAKSLPKDVKKVVSWHDFQSTPALETLRPICADELRLGSVAKVVTMATSAEDNVTALTLCGDRPGRIVAFCMGGLGTVSRVASIRLGAPLAYASLPNQAVVPGQLSTRTMRTLMDLVA
ncbi:MAG: type I 3-dehydroquinate dehydratase [Thaumarchaeota archaeon]|nr:type I 3-dehydroquinate dehydratase [Nitrososphaerota archaeon]